MAAKSFLRLANGILSAVSGIVQSAGAANDGDIPALDATGKLDASVMPSGFGQDARNFPISEALAAGALVNLYNVAGTDTARNADGSVQGKECVGFVLSAAASGTSALVYFSRILSGLCGLTVGARYYLSGTAAGAVSLAPITPTPGSGKTHQFIGKAISATELAFEPDDVVLL